MKHLTTQQLKELKTKLLDEKQRLQSELEKFSKEGKLPDDYDAQFENIGDAPDENAQEVASYENRLSLERILETSLQKVDHALKRMKDGTYGICLSCKKNIPMERLESRPESGHCVDCKAKLL
ncbi:MAG: TraR/DksA C4-type zinc finger protein [Parcubacteria group bacterium]|nr:TraR/DksA C4-type zinc finger protein [Parcubacteria group bacterium]